MVITNEEISIEVCKHAKAHWIGEEKSCHQKGKKQNNES